MDCKPFSFNATIFTGLAFMAFARMTGLLPELFAVACGMMLLAASVGCLHQSRLVGGFRSCLILVPGLIGLISLPLVISAMSIPSEFSTNWQLIGTLFVSAVSATVSIFVWSTIGRKFDAGQRPIIG